MADDRKDNGGAAFPGSADTAEGHQMREYGMSLRDWFAGRAMQSLQRTVPSYPVPSDDDLTVIAEVAYRQADAMLEARK